MQPALYILIVNALCKLIEIQLHLLVVMKIVQNNTKKYKIMIIKKISWHIIIEIKTISLGEVSKPICAQAAWSESCIEDPDSTQPEWCLVSWCADLRGSRCLEIQVVLYINSWRSERVNLCGSRNLWLLAEFQRIIRWSWESWRRCGLEWWQKHRNKSHLEKANLMHSPLKVRRSLSRFEHDQKSALLPREWRYQNAYPWWHCWTVAPMDVCANH